MMEEKTTALAMIGIMILTTLATFPLHTNATPTTTCEYLIITQESLATEFQILADWKALWVDGATVVTVSDSASDVDVKNIINDYYTNNDTKYVLLGGDVPVIPYHTTQVVIPTIPPTSAFIAEDYWFANLVGGNDISEYEVYIGRAPVDDAEEATHFVNKVIAYEQMDKPKANLFHAALRPYGGQDFADDCMQWVPNDYANYTLFETAQDGVTVPEYKELWRNDGIMAVHWGHGTGTTQYQISYGGNVNFKNSDTSTMDNSFWPVHTSVSCTTGRFHIDDESLAEAFVKARTPDAYVNADHGAIATFMCNQDSWTFHTAQFIEMQFWALYNQSHENIGAILAESKHEFIDEANDYNSSELDRSRYEWTYRQINLFGDPETPVLTKRVSELTLNLTVLGENQTGGDLSGNGYVYIDGEYSGRLGETFTVSPGTQVLVTDYWESGNTGNRTTFTVWQDGPTANPRTITFVEDTTITANFTVKHCPGDVDGDGTVTVLDLLKVKLVYSGQITDPMWVRRSDVNGDGTVNILDIRIVKINMGRTY